MVKWMDYFKIQEYKRKKFNKSQTARKLGMNRETVGVYWDMIPEDYAARVEAAKTREKKAGSGGYGGNQSGNYKWPS